MMRCLKWGSLLLALTLWPSAAYSDPNEDYKAGVKAYMSGDIPTAMAKLQPLADSGQVEAQVMYASLLDAAEFNEEAVNYYRLAAEQGNALGRLGLGMMYAKGEGVDKNMDEARKWTTLSAQQGLDEAVFILAMAYIEGGLGLDNGARSGAEALSWIKRAADKNHVAAMTALSAAYRTGKYGLAVDNAMADSLDAKIKALRDLANPDSKLPTRAKPKK